MPSSRASPAFLGNRATQDAGSLTRDLKDVSTLKNSNLPLLYLEKQEARTGAQPGPSLLFTRGPVFPPWQVISTS